MEKYLKLSIFGLVLIFAVVSAIAIITDSFSTIKQANPYFFVLASLFFILSIVFWIIPWALLLKKSRKLSLKKSILLGFSCVYGALTPVQIGAEALRSIRAKEVFGVSYSESISAAMIVKGIKFFLLAVLASFVVWIVLLQTNISFVMFVGLISGFVVILAAATLFLLPLNKKIGLLISRLFGEVGKFFKPFKYLEKYFHDYSIYLKIVPRRNLFLVFLLAALSLMLEFVALLFCFYAFNVSLELVALLFLFILISVLERTPFLPRGIGLVEAAGFIFLSLPEFSKISLSVPQIGAILVLFSVVRLIVPTIISFAVSLIKLD